LLDKKRDAEGQPTARIEHVSSRRPPTHEEINAWMDSLPSASPDTKILPEIGPIDSSSAVEPKQILVPQPATETPDA
jgi:hypothetical protein